MPICCVAQNLENFKIHSVQLHNRNIRVVITSRVASLYGAVVKFGFSKGLSYKVDENLECENFSILNWVVVVIVVVRCCLLSCEYMRTSLII